MSCLAPGAALETMSPASAATASDSSTAATVAEEELESPRDEVSAHVVCGRGRLGLHVEGGQHQSCIISVSNVGDVIRGLSGTNQVTPGN